MDTYTQKIKITDTTEKVSKNGGKYLLVKFEGGSASCFTEQLFGMLNAVKANGEEINATLQKKGNFTNIVGVEGVDVVAKSGKAGAIGKIIEEKKKTITEFVDRKENSMRRFAILRDSAMFAQISWEGFDGDKKTDMIKKAHEYWQKYFEGIY